MAAFFAVVIAALTMVGLVAAPVQAAPTAREMTLTFVRHGESEGNASGKIDTTTPGPDLTDLGRKQARQVAELLSDQRFDGVYASRMVRTQQTARPTALRHRLPIVVKPGFHEILAGDYEGQPESDARDTYFAAPSKWLRGDLAARIPGAENGYEFKKRVDDSLASVVAAGKKNPVIFAHGGMIMVWSMMTASNGADYAQKLQTDPLRNVGRVVMKGNPTKGWRIVEWIGNPQLPDVADCGAGALPLDLGSLAPC
ncbi:histidine phosphatase family protein [Gordonia sp. SID5947]|uniref:histidine phosphatase family protein n=1 Tax=Gordonia sp. SID5947 TaxID=2690315 RepID=UPI0013719332|nr:histidine phosphatase family protein [Gordonia sp. SID5947]MYR06931.1 histidine phosphatase family protein [Gordonia sp. SID5947]